MKSEVFESDVNRKRNEADQPCRESPHELHLVCRRRIRERNAHEKVDDAEQYHCPQPLICA
mgnify:CR=1 FL=1